MTAPSAPSPPTVEAVRAAAARFSADPRYGPAERALTRAFATYPANTVLEDVLTKVVLLNSLYSTNVYAVTEMAEHIVALGIDGQLAVGSRAVVGAIADLEASGRVHYSFASKYCAWHRPILYPIYDNLVDRLLWRYQRHYRFGTFQQADLRDYGQYVEIIRAFIQHFSLDGVTFNQLDKYLWYYAKELYRDA
ncbi:MAG: hypothetical protein KA072_02990 [Thermoanaerobaculaceae bacterium]|nr:hypothetical protein [Thermoanaerobaculaceae bacterium]MDI9620567.1 hypothetical protein [Acidobacteriota bacterium]NLH12464.1 hypothetical protein [Holophagae bacterium]HPW55194.1 hypothetical protein [Thermoanaerobaculaceae bacterium]